MPASMIRWLRTGAIMLAAIASGCATPAVPDDAVAQDAASDSGATDGAVEIDAGVDGGVPGPLSVSGRFGTVSGAPSSSGTLVVVDDGFDVGGMMCGGPICAYGGFR